jgi:hypothetical protein
MVSKMKKTVIIVDGSHYFKGGGYFLNQKVDELEDIENNLDFCEVLN